MEKNCLNCQACFQPKSRSARFCTKSCAGKFGYANRNIQKVEKNCLECGVGFTGLRETKLFCSQPCASRNYKKNFVSADMRRRQSLSSNYKMTPEQWDQMFESQGRVCAICGSDEPGGRKYWATDHCHRTNKVRGILCSNCNLGIGYFADDCDKLVAAAMYLAREINVLELTNG